MPGGIEDSDASSMPKDALRNLLFGSPFSERSDGYDPAVEHLDCLIDELVELLRAEHGETVAFGQAERELLAVRDIDCDIDKATACKRAVLLFALWYDPEIGQRFEKSDALLLKQLKEVVLPIVGPPYLANLGQRPDSFVSLCATLVQLWPEQPLVLPASVVETPVGGV
jgi:hypothetical protein